MASLSSKPKLSLKLKTSSDVESILSAPPPFEDVAPTYNPESPIKLSDITPAPSPSPEVAKTPTPLQNLSISSMSDVSGPPSVMSNATPRVYPFSSIDSSKSFAPNKTPTPVPTPVSTPTPTPGMSSSSLASSSTSKVGSIKLSSSPLVPVSSKSTTSLPSSLASALKKSSVPSIKSSIQGAPVSSVSSVYSLSATPTSVASPTRSKLGSIVLNPSPAAASSVAASSAAASSVAASASPIELQDISPMSTASSTTPMSVLEEIAAKASKQLPIKDFVFGEEKKSVKQRNQLLKAKDDKELESIIEFNKKKDEKEGKEGKEASGEQPPGEQPPPPQSPSLDVESGNEAYDFLYPTLDDPHFNIKIASKKEFADTQYEGTVYNSIEKIKEHANKMCNAEFELSPHQLFVRNFLSFQTPYNSLLLYHGLGTGKTCSAITICEEMRDYLTQIGLSTSRKIIVVASPNVQQNFRLQLFDRRKLKLIDGVWNIRSCTGNKYLKEINPMNMKGMSEEKVISEIKKIIKNSYLFLGYDQFASLIEKTSNVDDTITDPSHRTKIMKQKLKITFGNSLIVIDEFHNIRNADDKSANRGVANQLYKLAKFGPFLSMRLLLLSGTPMYNSYREIIWLINVMRLNDGRAEIDYREIFNDNPEDGIFIETREARESGGEAGGEGAAGLIAELGKENLRRFSTGYISYIRGENPYTFPFRIYPGEFEPERTFSGGQYRAPSIQINGKPIPGNRKLDSMEDKIYLTNLSEYQQSVYSYIVRQLQKSKTSEMRDIEKNESIGLALLQRPLEALNICYPSTEFNPDPNPNPASEDFNYDIRELVGKYGLQRTMNFNDETKSNYSYKPDVPAIFSKELIGNYSSKIKSICDNIYKSEGIILIYSFYIDGGVVPMALALESMGFTRYGARAHSLFDRPPPGVQSIDAITSRRRSEMKAGEMFFPAKYVVISGDLNISPDNIGDVKAAANEANYDGRFVKVIIISKSGTEGLDFKNIRQTHILEPWYNINLIEQTIGRAVRNCSHKDLEFEKRNVEIFLHGSTLPNNPDEEAADIYMYRLSERKARYIGEVSRVLKEGAIDCLLNIEQTNFTEEKFDEQLGGQPVTQILSSYDTATSSHRQIEYKLGDKNGSSICDYMECVFSCKPGMPTKLLGSKTDIFTDTILTMNTDKIIQRIRDIFYERYFYKRTATSEQLEDISSDLIATINHNKKYSIEAINIALTQLLEDKNEYIKDKYGRYGHLVNIGDYYFFQPLELNNPIIPLHERQTPVDFKRQKIVFKQSKKTNILEDIKKKYQQKPLGKSGVKSSKASKLSILSGMVENVEEEVVKDVVLKDIEEDEDEGEGEGEGADAGVREVATSDEDEDEDEYIREMVESLTKEPAALKKAIKYFKETFIEKPSKRGNIDWYFNCHNVIKNKLFFIPLQILQKIIVAHILEEMNMEETHSILNYIISPAHAILLKARQTESAKYANELLFDRLMIEYYDSCTLRGARQMEGILLINNKGAIQIFIKNNDINKWVQGGAADFSYFTKEISSKNIVTRDSLNKRIGFITCMKQDKKGGDNYSSLIFKTKNFDTGSSASRCDQAVKTKIIDNISHILTPRKLMELFEKLPARDKDGIMRYDLKLEYEQLLVKIYNDIKEKNGKIDEAQIRVFLKDILDRAKIEPVARFLKIMNYTQKEFKTHRENGTLDYTLDENRLHQLFIIGIKIYDSLRAEYHKLLVKLYKEIKEKNKSKDEAVIRDILEKTFTNTLYNDGKTAKNELIVRFMKTINYTPDELKRFIEQNPTDVDDVVNVDDNYSPFSYKNNRDMNEVELCIFQEILLRYFDITNEEGKRWFLTPIQVILNKIV